MNTVYLLLGGNQGDVKESFRSAIRQIKKKIGRVNRQSAIYRTGAWGKTNQPDFLNRVLIVFTILDAAETMQQCLNIESEMGRVRTTKNAARIIDIDMLFFNRSVIQQDQLQIPHPRLAERRFTLVPLNELSPNLKHPVLNRSVHQLLLACKDNLPVEKI